MTNNWLINPFIGSFQIKYFSIKEYEQLINIASDSVLKQMFPTTPLSSFRAILTEDYTEISKNAVKNLLPFPTTYLCEFGF
jgi:hypothetical protein